MAKTKPPKDAPKKASSRETHDLAVAPEKAEKDSKFAGPAQKSMTRVVAIGASAEGLTAFEEFFAELPVDIPAIALVVVAILSGTGSDGTLDVKAAGGLVIAQDPETTQLDSMPSHVIQEKLSIHETCLHLAIESAPLCVFNQDSSLRYVWVNDSTASILDDGIHGKTDEQWFQPETALELSQIEKQVLDVGLGKRISLCLVRGNKSYPVRITLEPLRDHTGVVIGSAGTATLEKSGINQQKQS
ncbi:MAG: hypothetical protein ACI835_002860 [Planctomycetota bacterium]|jgi:hypothetical protein